MIYKAKFLIAILFLIIANIPEAAAQGSGKQSCLVKEYHEGKGGKVRNYSCKTYSGEGWKTMIAPGTGSVEKMCQSFRGSNIKSEFKAEGCPTEHLVGTCDYPGIPNPWNRTDLQTRDYYYEISVVPPHVTATDFQKSCEMGKGKWRGAP